MCIPKSNLAPIACPTNYTQRTHNACFLPFPGEQQARGRMVELETTHFWTTASPLCQERSELHSLSPQVRLQEERSRRLRTDPWNRFYQLLRHARIYPSSPDISNSKLPTKDHVERGGTRILEFSVVVDKKGREVPT